MSQETSQTGKIEREYVIPLREKCRIVPRYKKANRAIKTIKEFLARHMKIRDRDLGKIKIDRYLNEFVWLRGIRKPPAKVKVKAILEKDSKGNEVVRAELAEMPEKLKFKKAREERKEQKALEAVSEKKPETTAEAEQKAEEKQEKQAEKEAAESKESEEEKKEKIASVIEAGEKAAKSEHKLEKHKSDTALTKKQPKHQFRKALAK